jgi:hypothetical protein
MNEGGDRGRREIRRSPWPRLLFWEGSSGVPGGYLTKRLIKAPNNALPRFRTL